MPNKLLYLLVICWIFSIQETHAQVEGREYLTVTNYIHISPDGYTILPADGKLVAFVLRNIDSLGNINWESEKIADFEKDETGYFVKLNTPSSLLNNSSGMWCTAYFVKQLQSGNDTIEIKYGGVKLSKIKLTLKSSPEGAETFLIPNRIWMTKLEKQNWKKENVLEKFRVNTSSTNTYAFIDQTVYVVIYKIGRTFKKAIHFTKPESIEEEQTVWVKF